MMLPQGEATPFVRTDFSSDEVWRDVLAAASQESPDGFRAQIEPIDDEAFASANPSDLAALAERATDHALVIIADRVTMTDPDRTLLCVDPFAPDASFRVIPSELWGVENNLSVANMDFSDFASAVDADGVFRGFPD